MLDEEEAFLPPLVAAAVVDVMRHWPGPAALGYDTKCRTRKNRPSMGNLNSYATTLQREDHRRIERPMPQLKPEEAETPLTPEDVMFRPTLMYELRWLMQDAGPAVDRDRGPLLCPVGQSPFCRCFDRHNA